MLDYEEYGNSFRTPRALRDDGGPANNEFNQYDGQQTQAEGRPPAGEEDPTKKKKPTQATPDAQAPAPSPTAGMTFSQMQQGGFARPPAPSINQQVGSAMGYAGTSAGLPWENNYGDPNGPLMKGGAGTTVDWMPSQGSMPVLRAANDPSNPNRPAGTSMEDTLKGAWEGYTPETFGNGKDTEMQAKIREALMSSIGNPSRYDTDVAKRTFDMLSGNIDDDYNARDQTLRESIASRGLGAIGDGTIGTSDQRFQNLQRRSAKADMATNILREQANTYGQDRSAAIRDAMGYGNDQFGNDLAAANFNANERQRAYQNYTGYGQQAFENQTTAAEMRARQQQQQEELLLKLLGLG